MENDNDNETLILETNKLLYLLKESLVDCLWSSKKLLNSFKNNELKTSSGISLLELKNKMFLNYLIDVTDVIKHKLREEKNDATLERLVEERVVLERIRPIEEKLKYQVDMLMKTLNNDREIENNPLNARPNFSFAMEYDNNDETEINRNSENETKEEEIEELSKTNKNQIYVPPRLAQMKYEDDQEKRARNLERAKKRAINCSIINELRKEFDDAPEEEYDELINQKFGIRKFLKKKQKYEEENFIRLSLTKKQKAQARKLSTVNSIADDVIKFEDISVLNIDNANDFTPIKKSKKSASKNKKWKSRKR